MPSPNPWPAANLVGDPARLAEAFFNQPRMPQVLVAPDGTLMEVNAAFCELTGCDRARLAGQSLTALCDAPSGLVAERHRQSLVTGSRNSDSWEQVIVGPNGTSIPVLVNASLLRDESSAPVAIMAYVHDLRGLRRSEAALTRSQGLFDALVRGAMDWALVVDTRGVFKYVSPSVQPLFGFTGTELLGHSA